MWFTTLHNHLRVCRIPEVNIIHERHLSLLISNVTASHQSEHLSKSRHSYFTSNHFNSSLTYFTTHCVTSGATTSASSNPTTTNISEMSNHRLKSISFNCRLLKILKIFIVVYCTNVTVGTAIAN